jgi:hypothetical protein
MLKRQPMMLSAEAFAEPCAKALYAERFSSGVDPRSVDYKAGFLVGLESALEGNPVKNTMAAGTAQLDAFYSGVEHAQAYASARAPMTVAAVRALRPQRVESNYLPTARTS